MNITGLSLLGYEGLNDIDPVYCMPAALIEKKGLKKNWAALPRRTSGSILQAEVERLGLLDTGMDVL